MPVRVILDMSQVRNMSGRFATLQSSMPQGIDYALQTVIAPQVLERAKQVTPVDNSSERQSKPHARDSWDIGFTRSGNTATLQLTNEAEQMAFLLTGTRPHDIFGNPTLAFFPKGGGDIVFAAKVSHPGMEAQPIIPEIMATVSRIVLPEIQRQIFLRLRQALLR